LKQPTQPNKPTNLPKTNQPTNNQKTEKQPMKPIKQTNNQRKLKKQTTTQAIK